MKNYNEFYYEYNGETLYVGGIDLSKNSSKARDYLIDCVCEKFGEFDERKLKFVRSNTVKMTDEKYKYLKGIKNDN